MARSTKDSGSGVVEACDMSVLSSVVSDGMEEGAAEPESEGSGDLLSVGTEVDGGEGWEICCCGALFPICEEFIVPRCLLTWKY